MTYTQAKFEVSTSINLKEDALTKSTLFDLDLGVKVTQNVAQLPLHHVTYATAKFEVVVSNSLGDAFTRKFIL